jgi:predicted O-methyltransferase YrrM
MSRILKIGIVSLIGAGLLTGAGTLGWYANVFFGDPELAPIRSNGTWEARVLSTLDYMQKTGAKQFGVPESDGRRLRVLAEALGARNVVEIGTSTGYSGLWLCLGVRQSDGHITSFEIYPTRAAQAREFFRRAGVENQITVVEGDAHKNLSALKGPVDLVFLDADKDGYSDYLRQVLPLLRPGGMILAHNISQAPEYLRAVAANPELETIHLTQGSGLVATLKKR